MENVYKNAFRTTRQRLGSDTAGLDGPRSKNLRFSGTSLLCAL